MTVSNARKLYIGDGRSTAPGTLETLAKIIQHFHVITPWEYPVRLEGFFTSPKHSDIAIVTKGPRDERTAKFRKHPTSEHFYVLDISLFADLWNAYSLTDPLEHIPVWRSEHSPRRAQATLLHTALGFDELDKPRPLYGHRRKIPVVTRPRIEAIKPPKEHVGGRRTVQPGLRAQKKKFLRGEHFISHKGRRRKTP